MGEINTDLPIEKVIINDIEVPVAVPSGYANVGDTTASADTVMEGKEFYNAQGEKTVGTYKDMLQARVDETNSARCLFYNYEGTSLDIKNLDTSRVTSMQQMFGYCNNLTSLDLSNFDTNEVTNMNEIFAYCNKLTSLDLSKFNTSKVTLMGLMFAQCKELTTLDLSSFDVRNVTNMLGVFYGCSSLTSLDLSSWITSNVTTMSSMFNACSKLISLDLSNFDMTKVTNTNSMFYYCDNLTNVILPSTIKEIGNTFFQGCYKLTEFTILADTPPTLASTSTNIIPSNVTKIKIPAGTKTAYETATNWSALTSRLTFEELPA